MKTFQKFPAVTFCNMNPFRKSNIEKNAELADLLGTSANNAAKRRKKREADSAAKSRKKRYIVGRLIYYYFPV